VGAGPPRLSQVQRRVLADGGLLLAYLFGDKGGYVLVVRPDDARLVKLTVDEAGAKALDIEPGPLTARRLSAALARDDGTGTVELLAGEKTSERAAGKLAVLYRVLVPETERGEIAAGKVKRLVVLPDGPLAWLPLETLVIEPGEDPKFLLDAGAAVLYGPSATVLYNLIERRAGAPVAGREPVLSLGDPDYAAGARAPAGAGPAAADPMTARSRYHTAGGDLRRLPYSGWESGWVDQVFEKHGVACAQLSGSDASEANLRRQLGGRRIVHLACHGMADQAYGNFFGALAFSPRHGSNDPADDGFLTLPEIYGLDLKGAELAILSACETNYGPQQRGEGVWALSRGFLVAGARRVVCSNWLVDDEAAATLVSYLASILAKAEQEGGPIDYAAALHRAKQLVRREEKWKSPYYWGTFVLVGPD
jgi:CHAT domain-containing protein